MIEDRELQDVERFIRDLGSFMRAKGFQTNDGRWFMSSADMDVVQCVLYVQDVFNLFTHALSYTTEVSMFRINELADLRPALVRLETEEV